MTNSLNILITGAISGFGRETAQKLAADGHQVFASARGIHSKNADAASSLEQWANENQFKLKVVELDVSDNEPIPCTSGAQNTTSNSMDTMVCG